MMGMKFLGRIVLQLATNAIAILASAEFIKGFIWTGKFVELIIAAAIFAAINTFLKPLLKLFFGPFIIITLGLFAILVNAAMLFILDKLMEPLIIDGYLPLLLATLLFGVLNLFVHWGSKDRN
ncbi:MAG TPA: phage holin family protein [Candidatus Paceibacterota bacterium]|nr:phage holin family protein [Candidatus Paceibacterota bacterium]